MVLDIPIRIAAYWGAMSKWLIENPAQAKPPHPREREMQVVARPLFIRSAVKVMKNV